MIYLLKIEIFSFIFDNFPLFFIINILKQANLIWINTEKIIYKLKWYQCFRTHNKKINFIDNHNNHRHNNSKTKINKNPILAFRNKSFHKTQNQQNKARVKANNNMNNKSLNNKFYNKITKNFISLNKFKLINT